MELLASDREAEFALHLLSLGLQPIGNGGFSLPELVDDLLGLLGEVKDVRSAEQSQLLAMVSSYGGTGAPSYEHDTMRNWSAYQQRYALTFARLYDVMDEAMRLLERGLVEQTYVVPDSLNFDLALPLLVSAFNPADDWQQEIAKIARRSG